MGNWLQDISGKMSDAIPNEFSQLNGFSKFLPAPFNFLVQTPAALDRFGETYSNGGSLIDSGAYGVSAFTGTGGDPNKYGTGEKNWADTLGQVGNFAGQFAGGTGGTSGGKDSTGSFDFSKIAGLFGGSGSGGNFHTNSDGSGVYGEMGAPTVDSQTGELVSGGMDIGKMFEQFQKMQTQPDSDVYDPNAHADMIKTRYPWIPQQAFQQWLASQPPAPSIQFAGQPRL